MMNAFSARRREPRLKIQTPVRVSGRTLQGEPIAVETVTLDVSPRGASVAVERPIPKGTVVEFSARSYEFRTRASVRSVARDLRTGEIVLGLEFLDDARNPLVIWSS
jgi:hypothetical protein